MGIGRLLSGSFRYVNCGSVGLTRYQLSILIIIIFCTSCLIRIIQAAAGLYAVGLQFSNDAMHLSKKMTKSVLNFVIFFKMERIGVVGCVCGQGLYAAVPVQSRVVVGRVIGQVVRS